MASAVLLALSVTLSQSSAQPQISPGRIHELENQRETFFHKTYGLPGSGYTYGEEGSGHKIMFPIGRSNVLFYQSYTGRMGHPSTYTVTKWRADGRTYKRVWQMSFHKAAEGRPPTGTLLLVGYEMGYCPDVNHSQWPLAKQDLERAAPYAVYSFGEHGDVSLQRVGLVIDAQNQQLDIGYLPTPDKPLPAGAGIDFEKQARFIVLPAEVKLMGYGSAVGGNQPKTFDATSPR